MPVIKVDVTIETGKKEEDDLLLDMLQEKLSNLEKYTGVVVTTTIQS